MIKKYEFNDSNYGVIKYTENKKINMTFKKISSDDVTIYYYNIYLYEDFLNDTSSILSPVIFNNNSKTIESEEYNFEIETQLDPERYSNNLNNYLKKSENEELYLFFSFDGKVEIDLSDGGGDDSGGSDSDEKSNTMTYIVIFGIILPLIIIIVIIIVILYFYYKKFRGDDRNILPCNPTNITSFSGDINQNNTQFNENINDNPTPFNGNINDKNTPFIGQNEKIDIEKEDEYGIITSNGNDNDFDKPTNNIEISNIPHCDTNNNIEHSQPAPLPYKPLNQ